MKKILIFLILITLLFNITGCNSNKNKKEFNKITLEDENFGITSFIYDNNKDYEINEEYKGKYVEVNINSKKENFNLQLYHFDTNIISYNEIKETRKNTNNYKEYKWNNYEGYTYGDNTNLNFNILLKENDTKIKALFGSIESNNKTSNATKIFKSSSFQTLLNSISFNE